MTVRFIYYLVDHIADTGVLHLSLQSSSKQGWNNGTKSGDLELMGSTTGRIWYILKDIKNPIWKEIVHKMF